MSVNINIKDKVLLATGICGKFVAMTDESCPSTQSLNRVAVQLENRGLLQREPSVNNHVLPRQVYTLTASGVQKFKALRMIKVLSLGK